VLQSTILQGKTGRTLCLCKPCPSSMASMIPKTRSEANTGARASTVSCPGRALFPKPENTTLALLDIARPEPTPPVVLPLARDRVPQEETDLHGMAPDSSRVVLLMIDVINDLEWTDGDRLFPHFLEMAPHLAALKHRARELDIPTVYVNDNYGRWQSDLQRLVAHCLNDRVRGEPAVRLLLPEADDYFVLKPKQSGFYSTTLEVLLDHLHARTLIITGVAANICVLFTANDAYMRDFKVVVPADCVASNTVEETEYALQQMASTLGADITPSPLLDLGALLMPSRPD
jgi:nicotinamidase-related amidase